MLIIEIFVLYVELTDIFFCNKRLLDFAYLIERILKQYSSPGNILGHEIENL